MRVARLLRQSDLLGDSPDRGARGRWSWAYWPQFPDLLPQLQASAAAVSPGSDSSTWRSSTSASSPTPSMQVELQNAWKRQAATSSFVFLRRI